MIKWRTSLVIYKNTVFLKKITTNYRLKEIILQLLILDKYKPAEVYFHTIHSTLCGSVFITFYQNKQNL